MIEATTTVSDIVREQPGLAPLFEQLTIDYCCGGNRPLADACEERGLEPETVVTLLNASLDQRVEREERVDALSDAELVEHIVTRHHVYLRRELPRIREIADSHVAPEWACNTTRSLYHSLGELEGDIHQHVHKENNILFPRIAG